MALLKQSTAYTRVFLLVQSADHISGATGAAPSVTLSKAGGAFAAAGGTVTELTSGWYKIALTTTDTNTVGDLGFHVTGTAADPTDFADQVIAVDLADAVRLGLSALPNAAAAAAGGLHTIGTGAGQINVDGAGNAAVNVLKWNSAAVVAPAVSGVPKVDVADWAGAAVATPTLAGVPKVDVADWLGVAPSALVSGNVLAQVAAYGTALDPAAQVLATPAQKLATNASGQVTVGAYAAGQAPDTLVYGATLTEAYPTKGAAFTLPQAMYLIVQRLSEMLIVSTTLTIKKRDQATSAKTFTLNDPTNPGSVTEVT